MCAGGACGAVEYYKPSSCWLGARRRGISHTRTSLPPLLTLRTSARPLAMPPSFKVFALSWQPAAARPQELGSLPGPGARCRVVVLNPGAVATPLLAGQLAGGGNDYFSSHAARPEGTRWAAQLRKGGAAAQAYMRQHAQPPSAASPWAHLSAQAIPRPLGTPRHRGDTPPPLCAQTPCVWGWHLLAYAT